MLRTQKIEFGFRFDLMVLTKTIADLPDYFTTLLTDPFPLSPPYDTGLQEYMESIQVEMAGEANLPLGLDCFFRLFCRGGSDCFIVSGGSPKDRVLSCGDYLLVWGFHFFY